MKEIFKNIGMVQSFNDLRFAIDEVEKYIIRQKEEYENCYYCVETERLQDEISDLKFDIDKLEAEKENLEMENENLKSENQELKDKLNIVS